MKNIIQILLLVFLTFSCSQKAEVPTSISTMYFGGDIITMEGDQPTYAEAIVERDGKIIFVGSMDEAMEKAGEGHVMKNLEGKTLAPAFLDAHGHYISSLSVANQVNVYAPPAGPGTSPEAIVAEIKKFIETRGIPAGELVQAYGYDENVMSDGDLLNRDHLDAAFQEHPVIVGHVSMHGGVLNSLALEKFGYSSDYETPAGGVVVRKPGTSEPFGLIMETAYMNVFVNLPKPAADQIAPFSKAGQMLYAESGIVLAHEGASFLQDIQTIDQATTQGANVIDVVAYPFIADVDSILKYFPKDQWGAYRDHFKIGGVKITTDGSPQGKTALFTMPYLTGGPGGEKNWSGEPNMSQEELNFSVQKVFDLGVPLIVHTNGDGAIDMFLEAFEKVQGDPQAKKDWNVTTIHTQFIRKDHIPKFVEYDIRPSFYTLHTFYFASAHRANRGEEQASYLSPMRDAIDAGLKPTNHTDFYVAPLNQLFMMWSAVNRESREGGPLGPDQRISVYEALKTQTIWAAEQYDELEERGSLKEGKLADLVILDQNPLKVDPMTLKDIQVLETIKEGKSIFKK